VQYLLELDLKTNACIDCPCSQKAIGTYDPMRQYICWFMFENHTFQECVGNLFEIKGMLSLLFEMEQKGGWGKLRLQDADTYIIAPFQRDMSFFNFVDKCKATQKVIDDPMMRPEWCPLELTTEESEDLFYEATKKLGW